jgi:hypothetical protein
MLRGRVRGATVLPSRSAQNHSRTSERIGSARPAVRRSNHSHRRERVLIDELLLEVIELGGRVQLSRPVKRSDNSQGHECLTSSRSSICHEYRRYVRNLDQSSFQMPSAAWLSWPWSADQQPISASGGSARTSGGSARTFDKSNTTKEKKEGDL